MSIDPFSVTPEELDPSLLSPQKRKVLLFASYCDEDDPNCSNDLPCYECLKQSNVAVALIENKNVIGGLEFLAKTPEYMEKLNKLLEGG